MGKTISIIIPTYNCGSYLAEAIDSVIAQTLHDWECIIVDDGSTDNTKELVQSYIQRNQQIKYIYQENQGVSSARNTGIHHSSGKYILPLDGDDYIDPIYAEKAVNYLESHPDTKLVYSYTHTFGVEDDIIEFPDFNYDTFLWDNHIFCYAVYRREDYDKTPGYNPNMTNGLEDWDFYLSLLEPNDNVHCIKDALYHYRKSEDTRSVSLSDHRKKMLVQIFHNHPNIYAKYAEEILYYHNQLLNAKDDLETANKEIERLRSTLAYRIGKVILTPFRLFRKR